MREEERASPLYAAAVGAVFVAVALWRFDLVLGAWRATAWTFAQGGAARWKLCGEIALLSAILAAAWLAIPTRARPAHDAAVLLLATALGGAAEAWGTRLGLWRYYTGERPPLWIVPVWPLGALLVERLAARARTLWGPAPAPLFWALAAAAAGGCLWFCGHRIGELAVWAPLAALGVLIARGARPSDDFWPLAAGIACVFFADLWGTTNGCWTYPAGAWEGIAFGMSFDAAVVLACLRLTRAVGF